METTETTTAPRRLARPRDGRWLGGVAAGLGDYFDLSPLVYRVAFAALALAGGTGILLYVAAWLVIPDEAEEDSVAERVLRERAQRPGRAIGLALLAFAAILALSEARWWPTPGNLWLAIALGLAAVVWWEAGPRGARADGRQASGPRRREPLLALGVGALLAAAGVVALLDATGAWAPDWRLVLGAMVVLVGALVAGGALLGLRVGGLVVVGAALLAALALTLAVRVPIFSGWGDRTAHPRSLAALASSYRHGIGAYTLDLSDVPLPVGRTRVEVELGIGRLRVLVPPDATVEADGRAGAGVVDLLGSTDDGGSVHERVADRGTRPQRVLVLDGRVGLGRLEVERP